MPRRRLYSKPLYKKLTDTTEEFVEANVVEPGWILYVTTGGFEDEDHAPTTLAFGKKVGDRFEAMEEEDSPAAGIRYHLEKTHHFIGGEAPVFRVEGGTDGDALRGYLEGYMEMVGGDPALPPRGTGLETGRAGERRVGQPRTPKERAVRHG